MKRLSLFLFLLWLLVLLGGLFLLTAAQGKGTRYVSPWTPLPAQTTVIITHGLGVRPLELDVWVLPHVNLSASASCLGDFPAALPGYAVDEIQVQLVSVDQVALRNTDDVLSCVQVVVSP